MEKIVCKNCSYINKIEEGDALFCKECGEKLSLPNPFMKIVLFLLVFLLIGGGAYYIQNGYDKDNNESGNHGDYERADNKLGEKKNESVIEINQTKLEIPKFSSAPINYYCDEYTLEIKGKPNSDIYVDGKKFGFVESNGKANIILDIHEKTEFYIALKDKSGKMSREKVFKFSKKTPPDSILKNGNRFVFVPNCRQEIKGVIEAYISSDEDSLYDKNFIEVDKPFYIQTVPVTVGQFERFIKETNYTPSEGWGKDEDGIKDAKYSVVNISLKDAKRYIEWFSKKTGDRYRLPTLKEWIITINQNIKDKDSLGEREKIDDIKTLDIRYFMASLYEFSSSSCANEGNILLGNHFDDNYEDYGKKQCGLDPDISTTFRLVLELEE